MDDVEGDTDSSRRRRLGTRLGLLFGIPLAAFALLELVGSLLVGEGFVRGRYWGDTWRIVARFDPDLGWANEPGARARIAHGSIDYRVRINSGGFRDPERERAKPPGVRRVVMLGDSVTWGWGVDDGQRFSDLLEQRLGPEVEVLNLAVPGYGTDQQYWTLLEHGIAYEPDLVVLCVIINDVFEVEADRHMGMSKPRFARGDDGRWIVENRPVPASRSPAKRWFRQRLRALRANSAFVALVTDAVPEARGAQAPRQTPYAEATRAELDLVRDMASRIADPESAFYHLLGLVRDACAERGVALMATTVPYKHDRYLYEPLFPRPADAGGEDYRSVVTGFLFEAGERLGIPTVSVDAAMLAAVSEGTRLHCGDGHLNEAGNRVVANVLEPWLRAALEEPSDARELRTRDTRMPR